MVISAAKGLLGLIPVCGVSIVWATGPLLIVYLDCPVPSSGLLVYGHRPFSLCLRALFVYVFYAYGLCLLYLWALARFVDFVLY